MYNKRWVERMLLTLLTTCSGPSFIAIVQACGCSRCQGIAVEDGVVRSVDRDRGRCTAHIAHPQLRIRGDIVIHRIGVFLGQLVGRIAGEFRVALIGIDHPDGGQDVAGTAGDMQRTGVDAIIVLACGCAGCQGIAVQWSAVAIGDGDGGGSAADIADPQLGIHRHIVVVGIPVIGGQLVVREACQFGIALVGIDHPDGGQDVAGTAGDMQRTGVDAGIVLARGSPGSQGVAVQWSAIAVGDGDGGGSAAHIAHPQLGVHRHVVVVGEPVVFGQLTGGEAHQLRVAHAAIQHAHAAYEWCD